MTRGRIFSGGGGLVEEEARETLQAVVSRLPMFTRCVCLDAARVGTALVEVRRKCDGSWNRILSVWFSIGFDRRTSSPPALLLPRFHRHERADTSTSTYS